MLLFQIINYLLSKSINNFKFDYLKLIQLENFEYWFTAIPEQSLQFFKPRRISSFSNKL